VGWKADGSVKKCNESSIIEFNLHSFVFINLRFNQESSIGPIFRWTGFGPIYRKW